MFIHYTLYTYILDIYTVYCMGGVGCIPIAALSREGWKIPLKGAAIPTATLCSHPL